jgi:hypothetical protein
VIFIHRSQTRLRPDTEIMHDDDDGAESSAPTMPTSAEGDVSSSLQDTIATPSPMPASPFEPESPAVAEA